MDVLDEEPLFFKLIQYFTGHEAICFIILLIYNFVYQYIKISAQFLLV